MVQKDPVPLQARAPLNSTFHQEAWWLGSDRLGDGTILCFDTSGKQLLDPKAKLVHTCTLWVRQWLVGGVAPSQSPPARPQMIAIHTSIYFCMYVCDIPRVKPLQTWSSVSITLNVQFILSQFPSAMCFVKEEDGPSAEKPPQLMCHYRCQCTPSHFCFSSDHADMLSTLMFRSGAGAWQKWARVGSATGRFDHRTSYRNS